MCNHNLLSDRLSREDSLLEMGHDLPCIPKKVTKCLLTRKFEVIKRHSTFTVERRHPVTVIRCYF